MKEHFFAAFHTASQTYCEWIILYCEERFVTQQLDHYIKFSGTVVGGKAYPLSKTSGKPIFTRMIAEAGVPF
ncbi:MAG: hypothetical protein ACRCYS_08855 [Beijerinckiaceae bacterium]